MKSLKHIILGLTFFLGSFAVSEAQSFTTVGYSVGIPMGDMSDYIGKTSWRGFSFDFSKLVNENFAVGFGLGWQVFYEDNGYQSFVRETATVSGNEYRYVNSFPIYVTGHYVVSSQGPVIPYAGLGIGTIANNRDRDVGIFRFEEDQWHFALRPEVGLQFDLSYSTLARLSVLYNHAFSAGELGSYSHLAFNVGITYRGGY